MKAAVIGAILRFRARISNRSIEYGKRDVRARRPRRVGARSRRVAVRSRLGLSLLARLRQEGGGPPPGGEDVRRPRALRWVRRRMAAGRPGSALAPERPCREARLRL